MVTTNSSMPSSSSSKPASAAADTHKASKAQFESVNTFFNALVRKKPLDCRTVTNFNRCLNLFDLTTLGVGSTLGLGLYVLAGQVASNKAGPAVVISFALAALASTFSALCYAEFAGKVPRAGSAYAYSYITVGEFCAYLIGFNMILEYIIGASSVAKGFSSYLYKILNHLLVATTFTDSAPLSASNGTLKLSNASTIDNLAGHSTGGTFDLLAIVIVVVVTAFILFGVKESTNITIIFTAINLAVVLVVLVSSIKHVNFENWSLPKSKVPPNAGEGGFLPYGWSGMIAGSATCFFGFIGFDTIASSAEEAKDPKRTVPIAIILSLCISCSAYVIIAVVQTLIWPYYDQNLTTILPHIFEQLEMPIVCWLVLIGATAGLASSQLAGMYPLPRIIYSMAYDRVIYAYFAKLNERKLPVRATLFGSAMVALLACLMDVEELADFVSIGTLLAYSLVSISVLILRYEYRLDSLYDVVLYNTDGNQSNNLQQDTCITLSDFDTEIYLNNNAKLDANNTSDNNNNNNTNDDHARRKPDVETDRQSKIIISIIICLTVVLDVTLHCTTTLAASSQLSSSAKLIAAIATVMIAALIFKYSYDLNKLPTETNGRCFETPLVPFTPLFSIFINTYLMLNLSYMTWMRFLVWLVLGLFIYFTYGMWHSRRTNICTSNKL